MLEKIKDAFATAQSFFTVTAILAAGIWFLFQNQCGPRLKIEHRVSHRQSISDPSKYILAVDVMLSNAGNVAVDLNCGHLRVLNINPGDEKLNPVLVWPRHPDDLKDVENGGCLEDMIIEPGEGDQVHREISLNSSIKTVRIRSFFKNPKKDDVGWEFISVYDLDDPRSSQKSRPGEVDSVRPNTQSSH